MAGALSSRVLQELGLLLFTVSKIVSDRVLDEGHLDSFMNSIKLYLMYDVNFSTTDPSTDVALHLHPKKIYNSEYDSRIMLAHFLEAFQNFSEKLGLESTGDTGFEFLERTIGFSDIKMLLLEYLEYPIDQDFYPIVEAATKLLAAISGLYNVKWINSLAKDIQVLKIIAINLNAIENAL